MLGSSTRTCPSKQNAADAAAWYIPHGAETDKVVEAAGRGSAIFRPHHLYFVELRT